MKIVLMLLCLIYSSIAGAKELDYRPAIYMAVQEQAKVYHMDPDLILAVIKVESDFNPYKRGSLGEIGLFQLMPAYFPEAKYEITNNVQYGVAALSFSRANCPAKKDFTWVICHNTGVNRHPKHPELLPYYKRVLAAYKQIKKSK